MIKSFAPIATIALLALFATASISSHDPNLPVPTGTDVLGFTGAIAVGYILNGTTSLHPALFTAHSPRQVIDELLSLALLYYGMIAIGTVHFQLDYYIIGLLGVFLISLIAFNNMNAADAVMTSAGSALIMLGIVASNHSPLGRFTRAILLLMVMFSGAWFWK